MAVRVQVRVPATSANLGPGLDALGLALALHNHVEVGLAPSGATVTIDGEGSERFSTGEGNLVVRSVRAALDALGVAVPGLDLRCMNRIPGARGLGSSAAAIVAGVAAGAALAIPHEPLDLAWALDLCARLEGHPDNVAACLLGGVTVAWYEAGGQARAVRADPASDLVAVLLVPAGCVSTARARQLLPAAVELADAAHSAGRAALASLALTSRTDLLLPATEDRLHQAHRAPAMPSTLELLRRLRERGLAATISGAGPSVLVLAGGGASTTLLADITASGIDGFEVMALAPELTGVQVRRLGEP